MLPRTGSHKVPNGNQQTGIRVAFLYDTHKPKFDAVDIYCYVVVGESIVYNGQHKLRNLPHLVKGQHIDLLRNCFFYGIWRGVFQVANSGFVNKQPEHFIFPRNMNAVRIKLVADIVCKGNGYIVDHSREHKLIYSKAALGEEICPLSGAGQIRNIQSVRRLHCKCICFFWRIACFR